MIRGEDFNQVLERAVTEGLQGTLEHVLAERKVDLYEYPYLKGMEYISDATIEMHLKLYAGYVENVNKILSAGPNSPEWYKLPYELNGMHLHELYFENLIPGGKGVPVAPFDDAWRSSFIKTALTRGVGWTIAYHNGANLGLLNVWIGDHDDHHLVGLHPTLVLDCWEHAYILDYMPSDKGKYIDAFFANINWDVVNKRLA